MGREGEGGREGGREAVIVEERGRDVMREREGIRKDLVQQVPNILHHASIVNLISKVRDRGSEGVREREGIRKELVQQETGC